MIAKTGRKQRKTLQNQRFSCKKVRIIYGELKKSGIFAVHFG